MNNTPKEIYIINPEIHSRKQYTSDDTTTLLKNHVLLEAYENEHLCH